MSIPTYMQKGSEGPIVTILQAFLCGAVKGSPTSKKLIYDQGYGEVTTQLVREFQTENGLDVDGNWGPESRSCAKDKHNFDFDAACVSLYGYRITRFVQPDGASVSWPQLTGR